MSYASLHSFSSLLVFLDSSFSSTMDKYRTMSGVRHGAGLLSGYQFPSVLLCAFCTHPNEKCTQFPAAVLSCTLYQNKSRKPEQDANLDTKVSVFSLPEKPCAAGLFSFGWVHGKSFPPILWVQKASYVDFPLFHSSGWVHDKTAAGC